MYSTIENIDDIPYVEEYSEYITDKLYDFLSYILPERGLVLANESSLIPTDPYLSVREIEILGESMGAFNNKATYSDMDETGNLTQVFMWTIPFEFKAYKGDAKTDLTKVWVALKNPTNYYNYFGKYGIIDCNPTSGVRRSDTPIDDQTMELGAVLNVNINIAVKVIETEGLGSIDSLNFSTVTKESTGEVLDSNEGSTES